MRRLSVSLGLALVAAVLPPSPLLLARAAVEAPAATALVPRNFHEIDLDRYRGGKIESKAQLQHLRDACGVRTIVCLAKDSLGPEGDNEFAWAEALGMTVIKSYMTNVAPTPTEWIRIRSALDAGHVYIHCKWGADRTGAVVAKYRQESEGWDARKAFAEALKYGFKPWLKDLRTWIGAPPDMHKAS